MSAEINRIRARLDTLGDSLDDLEVILEPLLAQSLPETVVGLETIQQAKLQVVLPYLVYDLIFIYLKAKGIDPKTHPVVSELDRVRQYFNKIKSAEDADKKPTVSIDKDAASRFIKHAIAQSKYGRLPGDDAEPTPSSARVPVKITSKMEARAQYERELEELGSDNEDDGEGLEVFDEEKEAVEQIKTGKGKGKERATNVDEGMQEATTGTKRRRPVMDPFAGNKKSKTSTPDVVPDDASQSEDMARLSALPVDDLGKTAIKPARRKKKKLAITGQS
ncbi:hypothetical protein HWV62_40509 [Athelia sp. TMB]|nr:hypothetical protein HWV62_40509 [Athelia sp. TMB]